MRVTLDTNILVSGTFWTGDSFRILESIDKKEVKSILSKEIIKEYHKVIASDEIMDKIEKKSLMLSEIVKDVITKSEIVEPKIKIDGVKEDPDDNMILECAKEGNSDYIITQDRHLLKLGKFEGISILRPEEFLSVLKEF